MNKVFSTLCADACAMVQAGVNYIFENNKIGNLSLYLFAFAQNCYVKYDTEDECITNIFVRVYNRGSLTVDIEPLNHCIVGYVDEKKLASLEMDMYTAETIYACVKQFWNHRMETEGLYTFGDADRYIAADLLE